MKHCNSLLFSVVLLSGVSASGQIVIDTPNIGTSSMIPAQGETVTWLVPLVNDGEERWQTLGLVGEVVVLLVAHTYHEQGEIEMIRIISARKATRQERKCYEQNY